MHLMIIKDTILGITTLETTFGEKVFKVSLNGWIYMSKLRW